jgi:hypothetical protein
MELRRKRDIAFEHWASPPTDILVSPETKKSRSDEFQRRPNWNEVIITPSKTIRKLILKEPLSRHRKGAGFRRAPLSPGLTARNIAKEAAGRAHPARATVPKWRKSWICAYLRRYSAARGKIGRPVAQEDDAVPLSHYRPSKVQLERDLLFGKRREDEYASE